MHGKGEKASCQPAEAATPQHLLHGMDGAGVTHAVVVHPEPYQDDHRYLEYCLEVGKGRLKGTCRFFADWSGSVERMPVLVKKSNIIAACIHAYVPERLPPFGSPELRNLWKLAGELGLAVQLHFEPRYAPGFEPLIREFKDIPVIIDHLGRPFQGTPEEHAKVIAWSRYPHTVMKLSAIPETGKYPHRDVAPVIRNLADAWGADRLIDGGGFGAGTTAQSYRAVRGFAGSFLDRFSEAERAKVLGGNARRLFFR